MYFWENVFLTLYLMNILDFIYITSYFLRVYITNLSIIYYIFSKDRLLFYQYFQCFSLNFFSKQ